MIRKRFEIEENGEIRWRETFKNHELRLEIISDFCEILEASSETKSLLYDAEMLPYPKDMILDAFLDEIASNPDNQMVEILSGAAVLLSSYQSGADANPYPMPTKEETLDLAHASPDEFKMIMQRRALASEKARPHVRASADESTAIFQMVQDAKKANPHFCYTEPNLSELETLTVEEYLAMPTVEELLADACMDTPAHASPLKAGSRPSTVNPNASDSLSKELDHLERDSASSYYWMLIWAWAYYIFKILVLFSGVSAILRGEFWFGISGILAPLLASREGVSMARGIRNKNLGYYNRSLFGSLIFSGSFLAISLYWANLSGWYVRFGGLNFSGVVWCLIGFSISLISRLLFLRQIKGHKRHV